MKKKFLSSNAIETHIVEKHMKRPTKCANIVLKFGDFENLFKVSSNFQLFEVSFVLLHLLVS